MSFQYSFGKKQNERKKNPDVKEVNKLMIILLRGH